MSAPKASMRLSVAAIAALAVVTGGIFAAGAQAAVPSPSATTHAVAGLTVGSTSFASSAVTASATEGTHQITFALASKDAAGLKNFLAQPNHPALSSAEFNARFGPDLAGVAKISAWAASQGLTFKHEAGAQLATLSGPTSAMAAALETSFATYSTKTLTYTAATRDASLPTEISGYVSGVIGVQAPNERKVATHGATVAPLEAKTAAGSTTPASLQKHHNAPSQYTGKGQQMAIISSGILTGVESDLRKFEQKYSLPQVKVNVVKVDNVTKDDSAGDLEWDLDSQWSTAMAPDVDSITFYTGIDLGDSLLNALGKWVDDNQIPQGDASWGDCLTGGVEDNGEKQMFETILSKAVAQGQTLFNSSGDTGSKCPPNDGKGHNGSVDKSWKDGVSAPSNTPYVLSVGGSVVGSSLASDTGWKAGGGSALSQYAAPDWQKDAGGSFDGKERGVPDVAAAATDIPIYSAKNGGFVSVIGTSASAPETMGLWSRLQQAAGKNLGFAAPLFYKNAGSFADITSGSNTGYNAVKGWDYVTGLGSLDMSKAVGSIAGK